jgi:6-phosphogluconate dehydrogenase
MEHTMKTQSYEIGMVGLGVMGRNLLLNMADHGHSVAGYDKDTSKIEAMGKEAEGRDTRGATSLKELVALLQVPSAEMMLVPAGAPVDAVIRTSGERIETGMIVCAVGTETHPLIKGLGIPLEKAD